MNNEFEFHFSLDEENENDEYKFVTHTFDVVATNPTGEELKKNIDQGRDQGFVDKVSELEEDYGVHDVGFSPDTQFYGFTTYEVEEDLVSELVEKWKEYFEYRGFTVTNHKVEEGFE